MMVTIPGSIPIRIHPFFWLLIFGLGWINSLNLGSGSQRIYGTLIWAAVILVSIIVHELGHALTAILFGQKAEIDLVGFGGLTSRSGKKLKLWQEFIIVMNGLLAGFALCVLAYMFLQNVNLNHFNPWQYAIAVAVYVNLFWTILNLLPIYPLDGGHLLRIVLEGMFGIRGIQIALFFSMCLAGLIAGISFAYGLILLGAILFMFAFDSYRQWSQSRNMTAADTDTGLQGVFEEADKALKRGDKAVAEQKLWDVYRNTDRGILHSTSAFYLANLLSSKGDYQQAYDLLNPEKGIFEHSVIPLYHQLAWKTGHLDEAASLSNQSYQVRPDYRTALTNAYIYAAKHDATATIGWLKRAISDGLPNPVSVLNQQDFTPFKNEPHFQDLLRSSKEIKAT